MCYTLLHNTKPFNIEVIVVKGTYSWGVWAMLTFNLIKTKKFNWYKIWNFDRYN